MPEPAYAQSLFKISSYAATGPNRMVTIHLPLTGFQSKELILTPGLACPHSPPSPSHTICHTGCPEGIAMLETQPHSLPSTSHMAPQTDTVRRAASSHLPGLPTPSPGADHPHSLSQATRRGSASLPPGLPSLYAAPRLTHTAAHKQSTGACHALSSPMPTAGAYQPCSSLQAVPEHMHASARPAGCLSCCGAPRPGAR